MGKDVLARLVGLVAVGFMVSELLKLAVFHDTDVGGWLHTIIILGLLVLGTKDLWMTATQKGA